MLDAKLILCTDQALGDEGNVVSENIIDLGANETALGEEENLRIRVEMSETATSEGAATLLMRAVSEVDETIDGDSVEFATTPALGKSTLVAGYCIMDVGLPVNHNRYIALYWTVGTADFGNGKVNAYIYAR